jgi:fructosamine-3-kinase
LSGETAIGDPERVVALRTEFARRHPRWQAVLHPAGEGLEFAVYRAIHPDWGVVAVKVPKARIISNANDERIDARDVLRQEGELGELMRAAGVATPKLFDLCLDGRSTDYLIAAYVRHDGSGASAEANGALLAQIHAVRPPPGLRCAAQIRPSLPETLASLIARRAHGVERLAGIELGLPPVERMAQMLDREHGPLALLHMDFRPANVLADRGRIVGVVDWANALVGDPALEIARAAEYGAWEPGFAAGYGSDPLAAQSEPVALLYRLYTATMLALVFLSEAPDPLRARTAIHRLQVLAGLLRR